MYFDGYSWDAPDANIAYFIEGQGYWMNDPSSPQQPLPYWGNSNGSAVPSFYFQTTTPTMEANLLVALGSWAPYNSLGWYNPNNLSEWGWIFQADGTAPVLQTVDFTPTPTFGLFFVPDSLTNDPANSNQLYYTDSALNGIAAADVAFANANNMSLGLETGQHFAVFDSGSGGYYIGIKDRSLQVSDHDYNDMIVVVSDVPEPRWLLPLALLLVAIPRIKSRLSEPAQTIDSTVHRRRDRIL